MRVIETKRQLTFLLSMCPRPKEFITVFAHLEKLLDRLAHNFRTDKASAVGIRAVVPSCVDKFAIRFDKWEMTVWTYYVDFISKVRS